MRKLPTALAAATLVVLASAGPALALGNDPGQGPGQMNGQSQGRGPQGSEDRGPGRGPGQGIGLGAQAGLTPTQAKAVSEALTGCVGFPRTVFVGSKE